MRSCVRVPLGGQNLQIYIFKKTYTHKHQHYNNFALREIRIKRHRLLVLHTLGPDDEPHAVFHVYGIEYTYKSGIPQIHIFWCSNSVVTSNYIVSHLQYKCLLHQAVRI